MRIAVVHDWLVTYAGAERVLEQILSVYPDADIFCLMDFLPDSDREFLKGKKITTSFIQSLPFVRNQYRRYLPLMPLAVEQFDLSGYDLVVSCSHAVAKGVLTGPDQFHISYVHTPIRYAWDLQHQYLKESGLDKGFRGLVAKAVLHYMRQWDYRTANGVDNYIANSRFIARRIWKVYRREATVIYPPVDTETFSLCEAKEDFYLTASRMVPYKRIGLIVAAFRAMPDKKLVVIGEGPDYSKIRKMGAPNIEFLGYQPSEQLKSYMQRARAFIYAAEDDFGIVPVEAQACGTPVIAYGRGGAQESIRGLDADNPTGVFFFEQTVRSLVDAVEIFEGQAHNISPGACRENALRFAPEHFRLAFKKQVETAGKMLGI